MGKRRDQSGSGRKTGGKTHEIKGTGLHVNVADQNACLVMPAPLIAICPPLLTVCLDQGISFVCADVCMGV